MGFNRLKDTVNLGAQVHLRDKNIPASAKYAGIPDKKIWEDFRNGDEAAFIHIYSSFFQELISFGFQFTTDKQLIEDCVQDLFVVIRRKRKTLSPIKTSIRLYLFQALKRRILDYKKKYSRISNIDSEEGMSAFEIVLPLETHIINEQAYNERIDRLNQAINDLTARQREAIYYLYFKCMSYEEIKAMMGLNNVKSARNFIYKAVAALKPYLKTCTALFFVDLLSAAF